MGIEIIGLQKSGGNKVVIPSQAGSVGDVGPSRLSRGHAVNRPDTLSYTFPSFS